MQARARLFGHPIHQMLVPIPFGLLVTGVLLDVVSRFVDVAALTVVSFWNLTMGIAMGLLAAIFGLIDWTAIPKRTRAKRVGAVHAIGNVVVLGLLGGAIGMRMNRPFFRLDEITFALELGALVLVGVTGWLGGELVDQLGVGVEPDAHPNAPSSFGKHTTQSG